MDAIEDGEFVEMEVIMQQEPHIDDLAEEYSHLVSGGQEDSERGKQILARLAELQEEAIVAMRLKGDIATHRSMVLRRTGAASERAGWARGHSPGYAPDGVRKR